MKKRKQKEGWGEETGETGVSTLHRADLCVYIVMFPSGL